MSDEQPKKPLFIPQSDKLGKVNFADTSEAQMSSVAKESSDVEKRKEAVFLQIIQNIVDNLPQGEKTISLDQFDQNIVDALSEYFDEKGFFKNQDSSGTYSEETLLQNKEKVMTLSGELLNYMTAKKLIENPDIKTNVLQAIDELYMQRVGLKKEEPQAPVEEIPEPTLDFMLGKTPQPDSETTEKSDQFPTLAKEKAKQTLTRLSEVYDDLVDQPDNKRGVESISEIAEDILNQTPQFLVYFMQYFGPIYAKSVSLESQQEALSEATIELKKPYDDSMKVVLLLVAMTTALSSDNQETKNYFFSEIDPKTLKTRHDVGFVRAVSKLTKLVGSESSKPRFEEFAESDFLTPKQDWEEKFRKQIFKKKPLTQSTRTA